MCSAVEAGYRHFDGAHYYANEAEVGQAIQLQIKARKVERKDLFIVSKVWSSCIQTIAMI